MTARFRGIMHGILYIGICCCSFERRAMDIRISKEVVHRAAKQTLIRQEFTGMKENLVCDVWTT